MDASGSAPKPIGKIIKRAREKRFWSQKKAAGMLHVSRSALNAWENDRAYPRSSIGALEELYGISLDDEEGAAVPEPPPDPIAELLGEEDAEEFRRRVRARKGRDARRLIAQVEEALGPGPGDGAQPGRRAL